MHKIIFSILCLSAFLSTMAQAPVKKTTPASTTHRTPAKPAPAFTLKTTEDSLSYAIGLSVANFYKQQDITNINTALVTKAINDVTRKNKLLIDEQQANSCIVGYMQKAKSAKASGNKKIGEDFLA